jgi:hypothetical protein
MNIAGLSAFDADMGLALRDVRFGWPPKLLILCQKAKLCDEGHIAFAQSSLVLQTTGRRLQCAKHSP